MADEGASLLAGNLVQMKPLLDISEANCQILAQNSLVYQDPVLLKALLDAELDDPDKLMLFKSCLYRGIAFILDNQRE